MATAPALTEAEYAEHRAALVRARADAQHEHSLTSYRFATGDATEEDVAATRQAATHVGDHIDGLDRAWEVELGKRAERAQAEHLSRRAEAGVKVRAQLDTRMAAAKEVQAAATALASAWRKMSAADDTLSKVLGPWVRDERAASMINTLVMEDGAASHVSAILHLAGLDLERYAGNSAAHVHGGTADLTNHISQVNRQIELRVAAHIPELREGEEA